MRLGEYLKKKYPDLTNRSLKRALDMGACTVNGRIEKFSSLIINPKSDKIKFRFVESNAQANLKISKNRIIFEDDYLLVYDKEAGHATMNTETARKPNLHQALKQELKLKFLEPAHRLDKDTSGLIIFAKQKPILEKLNQAFKDKKIKKEYQAIVDGAWSRKSQGKIETYLSLKKKIGSMQIWQSSPTETPRSKLAISNYEIIRILKNITHLKLRPETGRTHQLRVHMGIMGHPILGDSTYAAKFKSQILVPRHLLHASRLEFTHPFSGEKLILESPLPEDFRALLKDSSK